MQSRLPASAYADPARFGLEMEIFRQIWQFAGFSFQLKNHNDFVVREIGKKSIVVQNLHGDLHAFQNVCSHRFSRIQTQRCGNRALQCPYHGWTYNAEGIPSGIPKRPRFDDLTPEKCQQLQLSRWRVETCGAMVFVTENINGSDLSTSLAEARSNVEQLSSAFGELLDTNELLIKANWKILVENTLESYHVNFVHTDSFRRLGAGDGIFGWQGNHSSWNTPVSTELLKSLSRPLKSLANRPYAIEGYQHQLIFPNITIATTFGTSFSVQLFEPLAYNSTRFTSYLFATALDDPTPTQQSILHTLSLSATTFNRQVFEEDRVVCEQVQLGSEESERPGLLSDEEERVGQFQRAYLHVFEQRHPQIRRMVIVGAGDFARELYGWIQDNHPHKSASHAVIFLDDNPLVFKEFPDLQTLYAGSLADFQALGGDEFLLAIGDPTTKLKLAKELKQRGVVIGSFVHRTAVIEKTAKLGEGCIVCPGAVVSCGANVGDFSFLNIAATVGHDATLGAGATLSAHADVTGHAVLGEGVYLGSHAVVLPKVKVGDYAKIGAGSVVMRTVRPGDTVTGIPAKRLEWQPTAESAPESQVV